MTTSRERFEEFKATRAAKVPTVVSMAQARRALTDAGLITAIDAAVANADPATVIGWEHATELHRSSPTLLALASQLGLTSEQIDDLFRAASVITF